MKIKLDIKKLLGFRILGETQTGAKIGTKTGAKIGTKTDISSRAKS